MALASQGDMEKNSSDESSKLVDIDSLVDLFKKKLWIIILITAVAAALGFYKASQMRTTYQAVAKIFIMQGNTSDSNENDNSSNNPNSYMNYYPQVQLEYYKTFMETYSELINLGDYMQQTMDKYSTPEKPLTVRGGFSFTSSENAPIFTVVYTSGQQEGMQDVLTAVCEDFTEQMKKSLDNVNPQIIDSAKLYPIYPNKKRVIELYTVAGLIFSIAVVLVLDYLDDTVKSKRRLERLLNVPVLGEIPKHDRGFKGE